MLGEMYPVRLCLHILPDAPASLKQVLGGTLYGVFGSIRLFYFERYQAGWISQQKVVESAGSLNFRGFRP